MHAIHMFTPFMHKQMRQKGQYFHLFNPSVFRESAQYRDVEQNQMLYYVP